MKKFLLIFAVLMICFPGSAFAHQKTYLKETPADEKIQISNPDQSQAIYGGLEEKPIQINFKADKNIGLYLSLLTQDSKNKNFSLELYGPNNQFLGILDGEDFTWTDYNADFDGNNYFKGPELTQNIASGEYYLKIYNPENTGKFVLLIGNDDRFSLTDSYYSVARTTNKTIFQSNKAAPWGLLAIVAVFSLIIISALFYLRKKKNN